MESLSLISGNLCNQNKSLLEYSLENTNTFTFKAFFSTLQSGGLNKTLHHVERIEISNAMRRCCSISWRRKRFVHHRNNFQQIIGVNPFSRNQKEKIETIKTLAKDWSYSICFSWWGFKCLQSRMQCYSLETNTILFNTVNIFRLFKWLILQNYLNTRFSTSKSFVWWQ